MAVAHGERRVHGRVCHGSNRLVGDLARASFGAPPVCPARMQGAPWNRDR